ncbi:MAG: DUF1534 domain-containing protein [Methyloprofundus sp.]|nr:DUF1534 domain-containing protein [Methyloprofundus sp.]
MILSFLTLRRGNAASDALRHETLEHFSMNSHGDRGNYKTAQYHRVRYPTIMSRVKWLAKNLIQPTQKNKDKT